MRKIVSVLIVAAFTFNVLASASYVNAAEVASVQEKFVDCDILITGNTIDEMTMNEDAFCSYTSGVEVYPRFEKICYDSNETIPIRFVLSKLSVGVTVAYECKGFSVVNVNEYDQNTECQYYDVVLIYDGIEKRPYFSFEVTTDIGATVCTNIYGYMSKDGLFISDGSFESAEDASVYYLVESGILSMDEYRVVLQRKYSQLGVEHFGSVTDIDTSSVSAASTLNSSGETTVSGILGWKDDNNVWHPMQYNKVEIWDDRYGVKLGTVYTDVSGAYTFSYEDTYTYRHLYVKIFAGGRNASVINENENEYIYVSEKRMNIASGTNIEINWDIDMSDKMGQAFQISQAVNVATEYVKEMRGAYFTPVKVKYPHTNPDSNGLYYENDIINVKEREPVAGYPETYASWDVIMHEYGHHVQTELNISDSPGGEHPCTHNLTERYEKDIGVRLAWGEAYPSIFGAMAQAYFASTLQNIDTVGDTKYTSYNSADLNYEAMVRKGEACEDSILGVLWDLFDGLNESYDYITLSHNAYWNMITDMGLRAQAENKKLGTLSEFCNYFAQKYDTEKVFALGKLLSYYKIAPSNLIAVLTGETPSFSWSANGNTYKPNEPPRYPNDQFSLVFYDVRGDEVLCIDDITTTTYTLTDEEWQTVMCGYGQQYTVTVLGYQIYDHIEGGGYSSPATGGYFSAPLQIAKPIENQSSSIVQYSPGNMRYFERTMTITPGTYYDLYVTFKNAGTKLIQTFSNEYTALELYSATGDLLVSRADTIDKGYGNNAFFSFDVAAETQYIIRVKMWDSHASGTVKVAMIPAKGECASGSTSIQRFEDIITFEDYIFHTSSLEYNYANVLVFKPLETGEYAFEISSNMDTFISVIDPRSPNALIYNVDYANDGGMGQNAVLTKTLEANVPYVVVYSGYDIWDTNNTGGLLLTANLV